MDEGEFPISSDVVLRRNKLEYVDLTKVCNECTVYTYVENGLSFATPRRADSGINAE